MVAAGSRTGEDVVRSLQNLGTKAYVLGQKIQRACPGTWMDGLNLELEIIQTKMMVDDISCDAQNMATISDDDARKAIEILQEIVATVVKFLLDLISKAPGFSVVERLWISTNLVSVKKSISAMEENLLKKCPEKYQDTANELKQETNKALIAATQAYS